MAKPMTSTERLTRFHKWGVSTAAYLPSWTTHNRNRAGQWGPVNGIMIHHTGDDASDKADARVLWTGRPDLPGPLCHWGMTDKGVATMIGNGRANHAGKGSRNVLRAVIEELLTIPLPGLDDTDGNPHFYGQETMYSGQNPMTDAAYNASIRVCGAICEFHEWTAQSVIGHKEWTARKPDPGHQNMNALRADVTLALSMGAKKASTFPFRVK